MNVNRKIETINSLILILFFIIPYTIVAAIDISLRNLYYFFLIVFYIGLAFFLNKDLLNKKYNTAFSFALLFIITSGVNQLIHGYLSFYNLIAPFAAYLGYIYATKYKFDERMFTLLMIGNYIYFIYIYYSKNSLDFFLPDSQMNTQSFINTSTNLIPAVLIINLYAYDLFNHFKFNHKNDKLILVFAIVNFILILLQRSRAGIVVSLIFLLMKTKQINNKLFILSLFTIFILVLQNFLIVNNYLDATGGMTKVTDYEEDARGLALRLFFENLDIVSFFWGYGPRIFSLGSLSSTQSLFLNIWNYYGVLTLGITLYLIIVKFLVKKKNMIPAIFLIPFLAYSIFEGFFLSNFWDFFIYIILFYKSDVSQSHLLIKRRNRQGIGCG